MSLSRNSVIHVSMLRALACLVAFLLVWPSLTSAKEAVLEYKGIDLVANLNMAAGASLKKHTIILILHDALRHKDAAEITSLQQDLHERGLSSLVLTVSYGLERRSGPYPCNLEHDPRNYDAAEEVAAWVGWLQDEGARSIVLAGFGWGADQIAHYALGGSDAVPKTIKGLVLIGPAAQPPHIQHEAYARQFQTPLQPLLQKAEKLVQDEEGYTLMEEAGFLTCPKARVTAAAFADFYGAANNLLTERLLATTALPVLVLTDTPQSSVTPQPPGDVPQAPVLANAKVKFAPLTAQASADSAGAQGSIAGKIQDFLNPKR